MINTEALPMLDQGLSDEAIQACHDTLAWSVWALGMATDVAIFPVADLDAEMTADPEYAERVVEVYKMMAIERAGSANRERIANEIFGRLRSALERSKLLPAGNPLTLPIDYAKVPPCPGLHPDDINVLRPPLR